MAQVTLGGTPVHTVSDLPEKGTLLDFKLTKNDLSEVDSEAYRGKKVILNIFPSVDTAVCATSIRTFNAKASALENTVVLCVSKDLPFAQARFCGAEGIENVETLSDFRHPEFSEATGTRFTDGGFQGLHARAIVLLNEEGKVTYTELVSEVGEEPDYDAAIAAL
ncbi:MAG: thiol peroxidase [Bacteroidota bacterium]